MGILAGRDADMDVAIAGYGATDNVEYDISDSGYFRGMVGFTAKRDNFSYNIGYTYRKGSDTQGHRVMAGLTWNF